MTLEKYIYIIINYFITKFHLENNTTNAEIFEDLHERFYDAVTSAKEEKLAPTKKVFSVFIEAIKANINKLENSADRRLLRSLLALSFMIRRESNKQKDYLNVLNLDITNLNAELELSKAIIFSDKKVVTLKFPRK